jgi:hypothetical protein
MGPDGLPAPEARRHPCIVGLARVALADADIGKGETAALARIVVDMVASADPSAADAEAVIAFHEVAAGEVATGCERLDRARAHASVAVVNIVSRQAQRSLLRARPRQQAEALLRVPDGSPLRRALVTALVQGSRRDVYPLRKVTALAHRSRGMNRNLLRGVTALVRLRRRNGDPPEVDLDVAEADVDLAEVAARLWLGGAPDARLTAVIASRTRHKADAMRNRLSGRDKELAEGFDRLRAGAKQGGLLSWFRRGGTGA